MTSRHTDLDSIGDIVERQSYLNGTRYYLVEGESDFAGAAWAWTLSIMLPKDSGESITEGDLSLVTGERSWFAAVVRGAYAEATDEALDAPILSVELVLVRRDDGESTEPWRAGTATLNLGVDTCEFALALEE